MSTNTLLLLLLAAFVNETGKSVSLLSSPVSVYSDHLPNRLVTFYTQMLFPGYASGKIQTEMLAGSLSFL